MAPAYSIRSGMSSKGGGKKEKVGVEAPEAKLPGDYLFTSGEFAQNKLFKLHLPAGLVYIDAHQSP